MSLKTSFYFLLFFVCQYTFSQNSFRNFLKPSDTLNQQRQTAVFISESVIGSLALVGLNELWYADYPKSKFHFINDNSHWMQMDKMGHVYSSYQIGKIGAEALNWSGTRTKNKLIYGASLGFVFLTTIEVMDGFSEQWGASLGDVLANAAGTALYVSQELIWKEQRIIPKFSFHTTQYSKYRPDLLGNSLPEQLLKDYNGQTYWLSLNMHSFSKKSKIPRWLNLAFGFGAEGMIGGNDSKNHLVFPIKPEKYREFYLSLDLNLKNINTKSPILKTFFSVFNTIKIPAPTLEYSLHRGFKFHPLYF